MLGAIVQRSKGALCVVAVGLPLLLSCATEDPQIRLQVEGEDVQQLDFGHAKLRATHEAHYVEIMAGKMATEQGIDDFFTLLLRARLPAKYDQKLSPPELSGFIEIDDIAPAWTGTIRDGWTSLEYDKKTASGILEVHLSFEVTDGFEDGRSIEKSARIVFKNLLLEPDDELPGRWFHPTALERHPGLLEWREE